MPTLVAALATLATCPSPLSVPPVSVTPLDRSPFEPLVAAHSTDPPQTVLGVGKRWYRSSVATDAERYLRLAMGRVFRRCVVATVEGHDPFGESRRTVRAKMTLDGKGRMLTEVETRSGPPIVMLDDGERVLVRLPDRKVIIESESPLAGEGRIEERLMLARQNYALSLDAGDRRFGRRTVVVTARPRFQGMAIRRYVLDAETGYPLSHEAIHEGNTDTIFRAVDASFPSRLAEGAMDAPSSEGCQRMETPDSVAYSAEAARQRAGFVPLIPRRLPMGFKIRSIGINDSPEWRSLMFRVSDGLVRATVYEWLTNPRDGRLSSRGGRLVSQKGGLTFMVVSDDGPLVRARLLDAFKGD